MNCGPGRRATPSPASIPKAEALQAIADTIDEYGRAAAEDLGLLAVDESKPDDDESAVVLLAEGEALIARALATAADPVAV